MENFAERLTKLRKRKGFNQDELAVSVGVSIDTVRRWEGNKQEPRLSELRNIATTLDVPVGELINLDIEQHESSPDTVFSKKIERNKESLKNKIVIQQGKTRLEIPATARGYAIIEKKLQDVNFDVLSENE